MRKFHTPRSSFLKPGMAKIASKRSSAVVYLSTLANGKLCAIGFYGKADKPAFHYSFRDAERRAKHVSDWMRSMDDLAARKEASLKERKEKLAKPHGLKLGDVLYSSWGYDQTNIDYYQVVELVGARSVKIRPIGCESVETHFMQGKSVPALNNFTGGPMTKRVSEYDSVRITSYSSAGKLGQVKVDGVPIGYKPSHWTAYA